MDDAMEAPKAAGSFAALGRDKAWDELDASGQIERMRGMVKQLIYDNRRLECTVRQLRDHQHALDGNVLIAMKHGNMVEGSGTSRGDTWF